MVSDQNQIGAEKWRRFEALCGRLVEKGFGNRNDGKGDFQEKYFESCYTPSLELTQDGAEILIRDRWGHGNHERLARIDAQDSLAEELFYVLAHLERYIDELTTVRAMATINEDPPVYSITLGGHTTTFQASKAGATVVEVAEGITAQINKNNPEWSATAEDGVIHSTFHGRPQITIECVEDDTDA